MNRILLLLCLNCVGAETNQYPFSLSTNTEIMIRDRQPQTVEIYSVKSPDPWFTLKLISTARKTNDWYSDYDYSHTNLQIISTHQPIVTEANGKWIITFKP